jgi:hypothetical protein
MWQIDTQTDKEPRYVYPQTSIMSGKETYTSAKEIDGAHNPAGGK